MARKDTPRKARLVRHARVRARLEGTSTKPRLCVFRSLNHIYAQVINDTQGHTIATASTIDPEIKTEVQGKTKVTAAGLIGLLLANRAKEKGVTQIVFDRGGYKYHGRIKALAEAAREAGLQF
jgi:large subunit ribosomal protein L18